MWTSRTPMPPAMAGDVSVQPVPHLSSAWPWRAPEEVVSTTEVVMEMALTRLPGDSHLAISCRPQKHKSESYFTAETLTAQFVFSRPLLACFWPMQALSALLLPLVSRFILADRLSFPVHRVDFHGLPLLRFYNNIISLLCAATCSMTKPL